MLGSSNVLMSDDTIVSVVSLYRLLNHWGYDVFNYDTDAVLLRDPSHILPAEYDIIGTFGRFPTDLTKKWGITLCTAILVVRSSRTTGRHSVWVCSLHYVKSSQHRGILGSIEQS